jgi:hypothetical protein
MSTEPEQAGKIKLKKLECGQLRPACLSRQKIRQADDARAPIYKILPISGK